MEMDQLRDLMGFYCTSEGGNNGVVLRLFFIMLIIRCTRHKKTLSSLQVHIECDKVMPLQPLFLFCGVCVCLCVCVRG